MNTVSSRKGELSIKIQVLDMYHVYFILFFICVCHGRISYIGLKRHVFYVFVMTVVYRATEVFSKDMFSLRVL